MVRHKKAAPKVRVAKTHLKYLGLGDKTKKNYKTGIRRFYTFVKYCLDEPPQSTSQLRFAAAEFVNFLYQDDRPLSWAGEFLNGCKRFLSPMKSALDEAQMYYRKCTTAIGKILLLG